MLKQFLISMTKNKTPHHSLQTSTDGILSVVQVDDVPERR